MEINSHKAWTEEQPPKKILAIRLQALGDTFIAISYLQNLRDRLPKETRIDILVRNEFKNIPQNLDLFDNVYVLNGGNRTKKQFVNLIPVLIKLKCNKYDAVLDLQNNLVSNFTRKFINPKCFVEFDRFSPLHAGTRTKETINKSNIVKVTENFNYVFKNKRIAKSILEKHGWNGEKLIVLNPGGVHENRNWPIHKYIEVAKKLLNEYNQNIKFLLLGTYKIIDKANSIEAELKDHTINLIEETSQIEVLAILQSIDLIISEDGGLLHMAYLSKINTIGILGATRSDWVDPKLPHTFFFTSNDLECGNCMLDVCKLPSTICIERVSVQMVYNEAVRFLNAKIDA